jgi:hypothetical protein
MVNVFTFFDTQVVRKHNHPVLKKPNGHVYSRNLFMDSE